MAMENWQRDVIADKAANYFVRLTLSGVNRMTDINNALVKAGFAPERETDGKVHAYVFWKLAARLMEEKRVTRPQRGRYYAVCPHCAEPILDVMGAPH